MFKDRNEAGRLLAERLGAYKNQKNVVVIGLPRGGVPVAYQIAKALNLPLDIIASRKLGMPGNPEAAMGAITVDGEKVLDTKLIAMFEIDQDYIDNEIANEQAEAERREKLYRAGRSPLVLLNKTVILVDDGVATGSTMRVAIQSVRRQKAKKIVLVVPVAPREFIQEIAPDVEEITCIQTPTDFVALSPYYEVFDQVEDKEVVRLMSSARPF